MDKRNHPSRVEGHRARKQFGQHFLVAIEIIDHIIHQISPQADDCMLEIGPGLGALTNPLLARVNHLHVAEIDRHIIERLQRHPQHQQLTIHAGDILKLDLNTLPTPIRLVGNLPYNISSPILFKTLAHANNIYDAHFMLQREVADRLVATPADPDYGRLSVILQHRFNIDKVLDVPPDAFDPPPKVHSAIVRMRPYPQEHCRLDLLPTLESLVKDAFSQRRKMISNTLKAWFSVDQLHALGIKPTHRAEDLSITDYLTLADAHDKTQKNSRGMM